MRKICFWSYSDEYSRLRERILSSIGNALGSGRLILGPRVEEFERRFSDYCGVQFGIGVNSGTDALFLALKALGVGIGDEVITVSNTAVPTVAAIRAAGATPVFADVEEDTFLMDASKLEGLISEKTKCIIPVHLFGQPADMDEILQISKICNISVIEDCAQAVGAQHKGKKVGSFGALAGVSFYPTKILGGYGDGGMILTNDKALYERAKMLRFYGMKDEYCSEIEGYNSRLDEIQAAILLLKMDELDAQAAKRQRIAEKYSTGLSGVEGVKTPMTKTDRTHRFYAYTICAERRDALKEYLAERAIETKIYYPVPIHLMKAYEFLGYQKGGLPATEKLSERILSLPLYPGMPEDDVEIVIESIREFYLK